MKIRTMVAAVMLCGTALAQQPYAGMETRAIKALSDQQIADLQAGRGMGLALAAELNGYPGPIHAIELADKLGLSSDQITRLKELFEAMRAETIPLGTQLIAEERTLDDAFAGRTITLASLESQTQQIGAIQGKLRAAHLKYHLSTMAVLTPEQIEKYKELRGYSGGAPHHQHMHQ
jgi:Spy/CpxP family protein refolding chaperone